MGRRRLSVPPHAGEGLLSEVHWIEVHDFRNLADLIFTPAAGALSVVTGENGAGKTSLLEAIGYCSTERSFRRSPREALVRDHQPAAIIRAEVETSGRQSLVEIEIAPPRRDRVLANRQRVARSGVLLDLLQVTVFTPDDLVLVKGGPEERRDYLDEGISAARPRLALACQTLNKVLRQRAMLLKQLAGRLDRDSGRTLDVWDEQLANAGTTIVEAREELVDALRPLTSRAFSRLTGLTEPLELCYQRSFDGELAAALARSRTEDLRRGITTLGPHRDELVISLGGLDARTRLSQGRQRAATLALRLAAHEVVAARVGSYPVLLLDDAFSELDAATAASLFSELPSGQAILTTAGPLPAQAREAARFQLDEGVLRA